MLAGNSPAQALECASADMARLLPGTWRSFGDHQVIVIFRDGDAYAWTYERGPGVKTERWGEKAAAAAAGIVEKTEGCRAWLSGKYTRYDGRGRQGLSAIGWPMTWTFTITQSDRASAEGSGYGREVFTLRWFKEP